MHSCEARSLRLLQIGTDSIDRLRPGLATSAKIVNEAGIAHHVAPETGGGNVRGTEIFFNFSK